MSGVIVPLSINLDGQRVRVGRAHIQEDGTLEVEVPDFIDPKHREQFLKNFDVQPTYANGSIEKAVRLQAFRYGTQVRLLEDAHRWDDRTRVRKAWWVYRNQFFSTPLHVVARDAFWSAYGVIAYNLYIKREA